MCKGTTEIPHYFNSPLALHKMVRSLNLSLDTREASQSSKRFYVKGRQLKYENESRVPFLLLKWPEKIHHKTIMAS